ncbi:MAG: nicotinate-nucleotide--dimethylbenzimidazole phosphoribosyltransferase [Candidatus Omnitrophica bacterium]|nr:nicotinate-nucleotide--dimethylbenzimidazole phosphoribosyltransferase [Candidatus Omnitrophota bacterium]
MKTLAPLDVRIDALDEELMRQAQARLDQLTKPLGSLGRLETLAKHIVGMTGHARPRTRQKTIITMAADHGVAQEGVSAYPQAVTKQMVMNFLRGGAGINVLARHVGARVVVVDMGVAAELDSHPELVSRKIGYGTKNFTHGPAMTREQACAAMQAGLDIVGAEITRGAELIGTGDMGIGNTTSSSAIAAVITGRPIPDVTGRGTGIDDGRYAKKNDVIRRALEVNRPDPSDPVDVLAKVGGFEIAGLVGVILGTAQARRPVVIDGFISGAAALIAVALQPRVTDYLIASHRSQEPGHRLVLEHLGVQPLLDLDLRLGEGTGGALAMPIIEAACNVLNEMATFEEAQVDGKIGQKEV